MKRTLIVIIVALVAAPIALSNLYYVEAFGTATSVAIAVPTTGDGSVAIVCGILGTMIPRTIQCSVVTAGGASKAFDISPDVNFASISSGRDTICGLQSDGHTNYFCWRHAQLRNGSYAIRSHTLQNIYENSVTPPIGDLLINDEDIVANNRQRTFIRAWHNYSRFPTEMIPGPFHSFTTGAGFFCAIDHRDSVVCWGPRAKDISPAFEGVNMSAILSSGEFHACGISRDGRIICAGNNDHGQCSPPVHYAPWELKDFAMGSTHTCAVRGLPTQTVVCWGAGYDEYSPTGDKPFAFLVANGNLTCGLRADDLTVHCWWTGGGGEAKVIEIPLRRPVVMGVCTRVCSCTCGAYLMSFTYCSDDDVVCLRCDGDTDL